MTQETEDRLLRALREYHERYNPHTGDPDRELLKATADRHCFTWRTLRDALEIEEQLMENAEMKQFHYLTCCVNSTAELINAMVDSARDVTYATVRKHCDIDDFVKSMGYENTRGGLSLKRDWAVSYHKSTYKDQPCYYIRHSGIEYIFVNSRTD